VKIVSEDSPFCSQSGRLRRVYWRARSPWAVVRLDIGGITSVPWDWTDLPVPPVGPAPVSEEEPTVLLSPLALRELVRFVGNRRTKAGRRRRFNNKTLR